jgi:hypothetical protein
MVRTVNSKYGAWIATYYDDFASARAIANDDNSPSATVAYDKDKTHYGNPMNGEAILNPRYRWSNNEINKSNGYNTALIGSSDETKNLQNNGTFEWLSLDTIRQKPLEYEGRAQLQYPDGNVGNKWRFDASGSDAYLLFSNGHDSLGKYIVPLGDDDATFGRATMKNYGAGSYNATKDTGVHTQTAGFVQRAHLAGVWMGETVEYAHKDGGTVESPRNVFQPVKSPSGQPFLVVQSFHASDSSKGSSIPSIAYDGSLNSVGDGDVFTVRFAVRAYSGATASEGKLTPTATVKFGYTSGAGTDLEDGLTGTPKVQWEIDLSSYNTHPFKYGNSTTETDEVTHWIDLDFVLDYTNSKFKVYQDGTEVTSTNSLGGSYSSGYALTSATAANMYGWEMEVKPASSQTNVNCVLMLDRAAMCRPLTDHPDGRELPPLKQMRMVQPVNGFSSFELSIEDEPAPEGGANIGVNSNDYAHDLISLFNRSSISDIYLLLFTNPTRGFTNETHTIDRPTWMGVVEDMDIRQETKDRLIKLKATDKTSLLDRQIPLWEVGQKGLNDDEMQTPYWLSDAKGMKDIMNLGASPLQTLDNSVGFDVDNNYKELKNQRLKLNTAHPIQMYNNEDSDYGPNNIETEYEAAGILGFGQEYSLGIPYTPSLKIIFNGNPGYTTSDALTIVNSENHDAIYGFITTTGTEDGNQTATFTGTYTPETAKIVYAGSGKFRRIKTDINISGYIERGVYQATLASYPRSDDPTGRNLTIAFDADPQLLPNDKIYISNFDLSTSGTRTDRLLSPQALCGFHKIKKVTRIQNYYSTFSTTPYLWVADTFTLYDDVGSEFGTYTSNTGLKDGTDRAAFSTDRGRTTNIPTTNDKGLDSKPVHAVWMRDLPKSLWFKYHFGDIQNSPSESADLGATINTSGATTVRVSFTSTQFNNIPTAGIAEIEDKGRLEKNKIRDKFIYKGKVQSGGNYYLIGCEYLSQSHATSYSELGTSINTKVHICNISNDYKHIWLLWSDMRNNGKANADGGYRKEDFGLIYPTSDNYEVSMLYADQDTDLDGNYDKFTDLKIGEELDIWNINSKNDPSTNGAFSKPADYTNSVAVSALQDNSGKLRITTSNTGSVVANDYIHIINSLNHDGLHKVTAVSGNTHFDLDTDFISTTTNTGGAFYCATTGSDQDLSQYQDWEDKGGSFLVIDCSKFFNMNTLVNGGKTGQFAGGRTDLGDFVATIKGYPTLIDNYWSEMLSSPLRTGTPYAPHPNYNYIINEPFVLEADVNIGDFFIEIPSDAITNFDEDGGFGRLTLVTSDSTRQQTASDRFFTWDGKLSSSVSGTLTGKAATVEYYTLTDSSATFVTDGVKAGMCIKNTTTPLTNETYTVDGVVYSLSLMFRVRSVVSETQLTVDLMYYTESDILGMRDGDMTAGFHKVSDMRDLRVHEQAYWSSGDNYEIPTQLYDVITVDIADSYNMTPSELIDEIGNAFSTVTHSKRCVNSSISGTNGTLTVSISLAPLYLLRLIMDIDGFVRSPNMGSYWDSDKFRLLWNAGLMQTWMPQTRLPVIFDINNVPITTNMTTYNDKTSNDSYGSIVDSRGKTLWGTIKKIKDGSGVGYNNGLPTTFSYLAGRDGRIEYRPKYNSGHDLSRDNIKINNLKTNVAGQVSHVRLYYRNGQSFVDYPEAALTDTTRWKILEYPEINGDLEALSVAKKAYDSLKESRLSVKATPMRDASTDDLMLTHGRYGYIADPYRAIQGYNNAIAGGSSWTSLAAGGAPFTGMANALNGNLKTSTDIYNRYGNSASAGSSSTINYDDNYYFYGANSLAHAVQIVHVPSKCPLVSDTTGEELKVAVHLSGGTTIDDAQFTIGLYDYSYSTSSSAKGGGAPTMVASLATNGYEKADAVQSGFYEIKVPDSYDADGILNDGSIVISFNADYCRALLRHRCGDPTGANILKNAHDITGITSFGSPYNTNSIFPLGMRKYTEMSSFADDRTEWYAPRVHITYDYNYVPATYVKYTDAGLGLNNETMVIRRIDWSVRGREIEDVVLDLERDESLSAGGITSYLFPTFPSNIHQPRNTEPTGSQSGASAGLDSTPDGVVGEEDDPNKQNPEGGGDAGSGNRDGGNATQYTKQLSVNQFSPNFLSKIKGRMALDGDAYTPQGNFGILGQKKPQVAPSAIRSSLNATSKFSPSDGSATKTADGFSLSASNFNVDAAYSTTSEISGDFVVSSDVITNEVGLSLNLSHGPNSNIVGKAIIYAEIRCIETNATLNGFVELESGVNKQTISVIDTQTLNGAGTIGNNLRVRIYRRRGVGNDNSNHSVVIHDVKLNQRRSAFIAETQSNKFSQFE